MILTFRKNTGINTLRYFQACNFEHLNVPDQMTRCQRCKTSGESFMCDMPTISYGDTTGGIPVKENSWWDKSDEWCREMGFHGPSSIETSYEFVQGIVVWCSGYDATAYKWCDIHHIHTSDDWGSDLGYWRDSTLDSAGAKAERITRLTCTVGNYCCCSCYTMSVL